MSRQQRAAGAGEGSLRSHHIDAIAHHFLSAEDDPRPEAATVVCRDVAVATPGSGRAAACAAAGLAAAAGGRPDRWGSCLIEDEAVAWSAFSYLGGSDLADPPPAVRADLPPGLRVQWLTGAGTRDDGPPVWLRWRLLGEASAATLPTWEIAAGMPAVARAAPLRWSALVWCVVAGEAAAPGSAECLGRLAALLRPEKVEILVVPDAWDARPGAWRPVDRWGDPRWRNPAHLQERARAAVGPVPACVRVFPGAPAAAADAGAVLLGEIAASVGGILSVGNRP
jgi:hypothetical protein